MKKFTTIKELYDYAVKNNIENIPFGIVATNECPDCGESLELMSAMYIEDNVEQGSYWENNKPKKSQFVWFTLDCSDDVKMEE